MDATKPVTPQINFAPDSPLVAAATQPNQDQTAQDQSNLPAPVNGGASIGARTGFDADAFKQRLSTGAQQAMSAGMPPLSALVVGAIGAHGPVTAKDDPNGPQMTGPNPQTPGQKTAGKVLGAVTQIGAGLGDAGAVGTVPHGGGALTGISRTLGARNERVRQERNDTQEANKNAAMTAEANTRMIHEQRLIHNLDEDAKDTAVKNGSMQLDTLVRQPAPSTVIAKDLTADQIGPYMSAQQGQDQKFDPSKETAIATGFKVVGQDPKTGLPIRQITYSLVSLPQEVKLDPNDEKQKANLDMLNEYAPPTNGGKWGDGSHQNMTGTQYNLLTQQAHDRVAQDLAFQKASVDAGFQLSEIKKSKEANSFQNDPNVNNVLANASSNGNIIAARNALMQASANPNSPLFGKYNNIDNDLRERMGYVEGKDGKKDFVYDKMIEDYQKKLDASQESITAISQKLSTAGSAQEVNQIGADARARLADPNTPKEQIPQLQRIVDRADAGVSAAKKLKSDEETEQLRIKKTIEEADPTASDADRALIKQIGEGRSAYPNPRTKEGARLAKLVALAYPDADEAKFPTWKNAREKFLGGKTGDSINSANTVLEHLQRAYEHTSWSGVAGVGGIGSAEYQALQTDKPFLTGELGKAVKNGVISQGESEDIQHALFGGLTPGDKKKRLKESSQLLMDKIDQYQQQFDDARPSKNMPTIPLLKSSAKASYDYIQSDGKVGKSVQQVEQEQQQNYAQRAATGAPAAAVNPGAPGKTKDGVVVWKMRDGSVQDAQGNTYVNGVKVSK